MSCWQHAQIGFRCVSLGLKLKLNLKLNSLLKNSRFVILNGVRAVKDLCFIGFSITEKFLATLGMTKYLFFNKLLELKT